MIHSVMSGKPVVFTRLMLAQTLKRSTCSAKAPYANTSHAHIYISADASVILVKLIQRESPAHAGADAKNSII